MTMKQMFALVILLAVGLAGCAKKSPIIGTWIVSGSPIPGEHTVTFEGDDKMTAKASLTGPNNQKIEIVSTGTYTLTEDHKTLSMTPNDFKVTGGDEQIRQMIESGTKGSVGKPQNASLTWKNDDEFTASGAGGSQTFTRKK